MKYLVACLLLVATAVIAQITVNVQVTLTDQQVWALTQDYNDYVSDTNNPAMTKLQWFHMNATNQILRAADRRVNIRKQQTQAILTDVWQSLTPEQQTNVLNALPPP